MFRTISRQTVRFRTEVSPLPTFTLKPRTNSRHGRPEPLPRSVRWPARLSRPPGRSDRRRRLAGAGAAGGHPDRLRAGRHGGDPTRRRLPPTWSAAGAGIRLALLGAQAADPDGSVTPEPATGGRPRPAPLPDAVGGRPAHAAVPARLRGRSRLAPPRASRPQAVGRGAGGGRVRAAAGAARDPAGGAGGRPGRGHGRVAGGAAATARPRGDGGRAGLADRRTAAGRRGGVRAGPRVRRPGGPPGERAGGRRPAAGGRCWWR